MKALFGPVLVHSEMFVKTSATGLTGNHETGSDKPTTNIQTP
jgi:hypothetical protein